MSDIKKYNKKPVTVQACIYTYPCSEELSNWLGDNKGKETKILNKNKKAELVIKTLEDGSKSQVTHVATEGDYIIKGVQGEFYPCKPAIFIMTYEEVNDTNS